MKLGYSQLVPITFLLVSTQTVATSEQNEEQTVMPKYYAGLQTGLSDLSSTVIIGNDTYQYSDNSVAYGGFIGLRLSPIWQLEATYTEYGKATYHVDRLARDISINYRSWSLGALAEYNINEWSSIYGRADVHYFDPTGYQHLEVSHKTSLGIGAGVNFHVSEQFGLRVEYRSPSKDYSAFLLMPYLKF
ncbi:porin family protein [Vibrio cholerae]